MAMSDFVDVVDEYFGSIVSRYNLRPVLRTNGIVRFENDAISLQVNHDYRRSYELNVLIGWKQNAGPQENQFDIAEILRWRQSKDAESIECLRGNSPEFLKDALERLALSTERYADELLAGNHEAWEKLINFREKESVDYALAAQHRSEVRNHAKEAWLKRDYASVMQAYRSLSEYLTTAERERLAFAERQVSGQE